MHRLVFILILFHAISVSAQECDFDVSGKVFDLETREPLSFVNIYIRNTNRGVTTDDQGFFILKNICQQEFDLVFSSVGYKTTVHHHDVHHNLPEIFLAPDEVMLESVVIEADKLDSYLLTMTTDKLSGRELEEINPSNLADITSRFTGVSALQTGQNVAKPIIHGLHSNRVVIINNGVRHEFQNWGQEHAPEIDPDIAEAVSVIKGAATVRYGPEALGGVILLDGPSMELHQDFTGDAKAGFDSNGRGVLGRMNIRQGGERVSWMAQGGYVLQGDRRAPDYILTNTGKREWSLAGGIRLHQPKYDVRAMYTHFNQDLAILRSSITGSLDDLANAINSEEPLIIEPFSYEINNPRQAVVHDMVKVNSMFFLDNNGVVDVTYAFQLNNRQEYDVRRGVLNEVPSIDLKLFSHNLDADWQHAPVGAFNGRVGMQWAYQKNRNQPGTNTVLFIPNYDKLRFGLYVIENLEAGENQFEFGLRYDFLNLDIAGREADNTLFTNVLTFQNFTATIGWERQLATDWTLRSNIGTAWRPPNVFELYVFGKHQATIEYGILRYERNEDGTIDTDVILDEDQKAVYPEVGYKWVTTLNFSRGKTELEATGYLNFIKDYIYSSPAGITLTVRGAFPFFVYDQTDAFLTGIDVLSRFNHNERLNSVIKASIVYARDVRNADYFIDIPPARINYGIDFKVWASKKWRLKADFTYLFRQFMYPEVIPVEEFLSDNPPVPDENFDFMAAPEGTFLANLGMFRNGGKFDYSIEIQNLLNQSYRLNTDSFRYFADQAGINVQARVKYSF